MADESQLWGEILKIKCVYTGTNAQCIVESVQSHLVQFNFFPLTYFPLDLFMKPFPKLFSPFKPKLYISIAHVYDSCVETLKPSVGSQISFYIPLFKL